MTDDDATKILLMLKAAYPHADDRIDERTAAARQDLYRAAIRPWQLEPTKAAILDVVEHCRFFPTVAELRAAYDLANTPRPTSASPRIASESAASPEAWRAARDKIRESLGIDLGDKP